MPTTPQHTGGDSLWLATADVAARPPLRSDLRTEVAVIGAGITGLSAAYELASAGRDVVVIDQSSIASGATGFTTAKISALQGSSTYATILRRHGAEAAAGYARLNLRGLERIHEIVAALGVSCDLRRRAAYLFARDADELATVEAEASAAGSVGLGVELVDDVPLPFAVAGAARLDGQAEFHPVRYLAGLADGIEAAGGRLFERTRAVGAGHGRVEVEGGPSIAADHVIVASHYPFTDRALLFPRLHPERSYSIAVRLAGGTAPDGMLLAAGSPTRSVRAHPVAGEELLLVGGEGHKVGQGPPTASHYEALEAFARDHWDVASVEHRWSTQDPISADGLPYVGPVTPGAARTLLATGYGKWGMALGAAVGEILRDRVLGAEHEQAGMLAPSRVPSPGALTTIAKEGADFSFRFVADRVTRRAPASGELAPGEGRVVSRHGKQVALSRDDGGVLRAVSARCTHQGCIVAYNDAERSWDCPCHGSRFALDGTVLEGPAVEPLAPRDAP